MLQLKASFSEIAIEVRDRIALSVESDDEYAVRRQVTAQRDQRGDLGTGSDKGDDIPSAHDRVEGLCRAKVQGGEVSQDVFGTRMIDAGCIKKHRIDIDAHNAMTAVVQGRCNATLPTPRVEDTATWGDQCINESCLTLDVDTVSSQLTEMVGVPL